MTSSHDIHVIVIALHRDALYTYVEVEVVVAVAACSHWVLLILLGCDHTGLYFQHARQAIRSASHHGASYRIDHIC